MKVASKILLIIGGALMLWSVVSNWYLVFFILSWPSLILSLVTGIVALCATSLKKRGILVAALIFGYLGSSYFIMIGALLGLIYVMIQGYKLPNGKFNRSKGRMAGEIILYLSGIIALATFFSLIIGGIAMFVTGVGSFFLTAGYGLYDVFSPAIPTITANLEAFMDGTITDIAEVFAPLQDQAVIDEGVKVLLQDYYFWFLVVDTVLCFIIGVWMFISSIFTLILSIVSMKAGNGKDHKMGIYIAVIIFAVFTLSILPLVGAIIALVALSKEKKQVQKQELKALPYKG